MKAKDFFLILLIGMVSGFLAYHLSFKKQTLKTYVPIEVEIVKIDTFWLEKVKKIKQPAVVETITTIKDTFVIAKSDTIYTDDSLTLNIDYYFPPRNLFEINYRLKQPHIKEIIKEVFVEAQGNNPQNILYISGLIFQAIVILLLLLLKF